MALPSRSAIIRAAVDDCCDVIGDKKFAEQLAAVDGRVMREIFGGGARIAHLKGERLRGPLARAVESGRGLHGAWFRLLWEAAVEPLPTYARSASYRWRGSPGRMSPRALEWVNRRLQPSLEQLLWLNEALHVGKPNESDITILGFAPLNGRWLTRIPASKQYSVLDTLEHEQDHVLDVLMEVVGFALDGISAPVQEFVKQEAWEDVAAGSPGPGGARLRVFAHLAAGRLDAALREADGPGPPGLQQARIAVRCAIALRDRLPEECLDALTGARACPGWPVLAGLAHLAASRPTEAALAFLWTGAEQRNYSILPAELAAAALELGGIEVPEKLAELLAAGVASRNETIEARSALSRLVGFRLDGWRRPPTPTFHVPDFTPPTDETDDGDSGDDAPAEEEETEAFDGTGETSAPEPGPPEGSRWTAEVEAPRSVISRIEPVAVPDPIASGREQAPEPPAEDGAVLLSGVAAGFAATLAEITAERARARSLDDDDETTRILRECAGRWHHWRTGLADAFREFGADEATLGRLSAEVDKPGKDEAAERFLRKLAALEIRHREARDSERRALVDATAALLIELRIEAPAGWRDSDDAALVELHEGLVERRRRAALAAEARTVPLPTLAIEALGADEVRALVEELLTGTLDDAAITSLARAAADPRCDASPALAAWSAGLANKPRGRQAVDALVRLAERLSTAPEAMLQLVTAAASGDPGFGEVVGFLLSESDALRIPLAAGFTPLDERRRELCDLQSAGHAWPWVWYSNLALRPLSPDARIAEVAQWLSAAQQGSAGTLHWVDHTRAVHCLRDLFLAEERDAEAVLWAAAAFKHLGLAEVLSGIEPALARLCGHLAVVSDEGGDGFLENMLMQPEWLIQAPCGVPLFLVLCEQAGLEGVIAQVRYRHRDAFTAAAARWPVLVGEYFLSGVFAEARRRGMEHEDVDRVRRAVEEYERELRRLSRYRNWPPATSYQERFNHRLETLRARILAGAAEAARVVAELEGDDLDDWIEDANERLGHDVDGRARDSMLRYIGEQVARLSRVARYQRAVAAEDLAAHLARTAGVVSTRDRLLAELDRLEPSERALLEPVYLRVAGGAG